MATASKAIPKPIIRAKLTSKGQVTIPVEVRKSLGLKAGDTIRFDPQKSGFLLDRDSEESVFEKWRGIGNFPGMGKGREGVVKYFRELRGHDDLD